MNYPNIRTDVSPDAPYGQEQDSCAIYMSARKHGQSTFGTLKRSMGALGQMGHRTGFVNGEGDGAGVQTDLPRRLWAKKLSQAGMRASMAAEPGFWVGHLFVPNGVDFAALRDGISACFNEAGLNVLLDLPGRTRPEALGRNARMKAPTFWQLSGYYEGRDVEKRLFAAQKRIEASFHVHFASLSSFAVVYKIQGSVEALSRYYPDMQDRDYDTSMVLCHARYSTNTVSSFERAQPFALLGHNGEINTINRFQNEASQIGVTLPQNGSDSQMVDRLLQTLCVDFELDLMEAMEIIFPPVPHEMDLLPPELRAVYTRLRQSFGPFAQGPAAILARYGDMAVASVDALGLRPLWCVETEKETIFSSERGAILFDNRVEGTRALAPGEKVALRVMRGHGIELLTHNQIRQHVMNVSFQREAPQIARRYWMEWQAHSIRLEPKRAPDLLGRSGGGISTVIQETSLEACPQPNIMQPDDHPVHIPWRGEKKAAAITPGLLAVNGWQREHLEDAESMAARDEDPVSSLGYDGPLAVLNPNRVNLADFFKETVAVVTNPAIDRGREGETFSTSVLVGARPAVGKTPKVDDILVELQMPLLTGGHHLAGEDRIAQEVARELGTLTMEQLLQVFADRTAWLTLGVREGEKVRSALDRLSGEAISAVCNGAQCLVLDDSGTQDGKTGWMDPHLAVAYIDEALRRGQAAVNLRRRAGLVVRSAAVRSLHDIILLCGLGADAVNPYGLLAVSLQAHQPELHMQQEELVKRQIRILRCLQSGLEKVISTMGCHELRGYGRVCSAIGLAGSVAKALGSANHFGNETCGVTWDWLNRQAEQRRAELVQNRPDVKLAQSPRFLPRFARKVNDFTAGKLAYSDVRDAFQKQCAEHPVSLRHLLGLKTSHRQPVNPDDVCLEVDGYRLPIFISAMSFGAQSETAYHAYIQAASNLDMICINGEGGELPGVLGRYNRHRGQQVASARFGVNAGFLNGAAVIEIKIGQGAKPGEGGMLPAEKVSPRVALARHTPPYVTLLSPSNNHDLYSIEDLAQLIEELQTVNPGAKISVKCPVVPNIGVIAVGIAKAGADILDLSGYDAGTGAARKHALQHVGLPVEIGVVQSHRALVEAGIRNKVELWCDGGMKTGEDVLKMVLLGANRVGFASMAMAAIGCITCRGCNQGKCPVGISTQIKTVEEARQKGLRQFTPLDFDTAVMRLQSYFEAVAQEVRLLTASLGAEKLHDLVGRADLLEQVHGQEKIDLSAMLQAAPLHTRLELEPGVGRLLTRPRNSLTRLMSELILDTISDDEQEVTYQDEVMAYDRALGSRLAGELTRRPQLTGEVKCLHLRFGPSSVAGNGFAAWVTDPVDVLIEGGAQDGVAKGASGGRVAVMKGLNHEGLRIDGSVGKSFAYGAQGGVFLVQGDADSRACIRLSGASVVLAGEIKQPLDDSIGSMGTFANLKGFACEYMTSGEVLILGDPGPYAFAGMTGGVVYQKLTPEMGFDLAALRRRLAQGAHVEIQSLTHHDVGDVKRLLGYYIKALDQTHQYEEGERMRGLCEESAVLAWFVKVIPSTTKSLHSL